jgi:hypothetical protein
MGDALAEAQLQQAGNQFWARLLTTVVLAGYFTFKMQHLTSSWFDFMYSNGTNPFQCCGSGKIYSGFGSRYYRTYANLQLKEM